MINIHNTAICQRDVAHGAYSFGSATYVALEQKDARLLLSGLVMAFREIGLCQDWK